MSGYQFTNNWFELSRADEIWKLLLPKIKPQKILEIGSFEGKSICYLVKFLEGPLEIHAVDSWAGGKDFGSIQVAKENPFDEVEKRFKHNTDLVIKESGKDVKLNVHKYTSDIGLARLLAAGYQNYFDFVYVDGSHETMDTLCDMILAYKLLREDGIMGIDDYLWHVDYRPIYRPKVAIDTFINLNLHRIDMVECNNSQVYFQKKNHIGPDGKELPVNLV